MPSNKKQTHYLAYDPKLTEVSRNSELSKTTMKYLHRLGNTIYSGKVINKSYLSKNQTKTNEENKIKRFFKKRKKAVRMKQLLFYLV